MKILLDNIGKRYNTEWIFRGLSTELNSSNNYVILGSNGSGKSTLLQVIASSLYHSEGILKYELDNAVIEPEQIFRKLSIATPYLELIEEFTLREIIDFHRKLKPMMLETPQVIETLMLERSADKAIRYYSSGMKQRVKLGLAILSNTPLLLLDEPVSNLDHKGIDWYQGLINDYCKERLVVVCSNKQKEEYFMCNQQIRIEDYKKASETKKPLP
jgi:ABC-type multidrug transport system ATPase subunit